MNEFKENHGYPDRRDVDDAGHGLGQKLHVELIEVGGHTVGRSHRAQADDASTDLALVPPEKPPVLFHQIGSKRPKAHALVHYVVAVEILHARKLECLVTTCGPERNSQIECVTIHSNKFGTIARPPRAQCGDVIGRRRARIPMPPVQVSWNRGRIVRGDQGDLNI